MAVACELRSTALDVSRAADFLLDGSLRVFERVESMEWHSSF
jgi:hypothetical protein